MTDNYGSNQKNKTDGVRDSQDLAEMLRRLRETVDKPISERSASNKLDGDIEKKLRETIANSSASTVERVESEKDSYDEPLDGDEFIEEAVDEILDRDESLAEREARAVLPGDEPSEEISEGDRLEVSDITEADTESDFEFDDDAPWYSDEELEEEPEDPVEEEAEELVEEEAEEPVEEEAEGPVEEEIEEPVEEEAEELVEEEAEEPVEEEAEEPVEEEAEEPVEEEAEDDDRLGVIDISEIETESDFEFDDDAPWYSDEEEIDEEVDEEVDEEEIIEEEIVEEEIIDEEIIEDEIPEEEIVEEEITEEEIIEDEIPEEEIVEEEIIDEEIIEDETPEEEIAEEEIVEEEIIEEPIEEEATEEVPLDSTDLSLLSTLGYSTVIDSETGKEELVQREEESTEPEEDSGDIAYDYDGGEYVVEEQSDDITAGYAREKKKTLIRLAITGGASLLLLIYEVLFFSGVTMPWIFNQYDSPLSHVMVSLQLLLIIFAVSAKSMTVGIRDLILRRATPYSLSATVVLANVIYTVLVAIFNPEGYMLFNFVGALSALMAVTYEYLLLCCEEKTFSVVSDGSAVRSYAFEVDENSGEVMDESVYALRAYRTEFNKNYFSRTRKRPEDYRYLGGLILIILTVAAASGVVSTVLTGNLGESLKTAVLVINFAMPIGALGMFCLPLFAASKKLLGDDSALIGQSVVDEYCDVGFVTFDEEELFPSMKASHIDFKPSGELPIAEILRKTRLLFSCIGGPIKRLVESPFESGAEFCETSITSVLDDGVAAYVDGSMMLAGSARFLELHGVDVNVLPDSRDADRSSRVLYLSIDGYLAARYYIKYRPDREFVKMVNKLGAKGVAVGIRTRNPGVNSDIIAEYCPEMKYKVYTVKAWSDDPEDIDSSRDTTESGLYAKRKAIFLSRSLIAVKILKSMYRTDKFVRALSAIIGGGVVIVLSVMGLVSEFNSVQAALYQLAWLIPMGLSTLMHFFGKK